MIARGDNLNLSSKEQKVTKQQSNIEKMIRWINLNYPTFIKSIQHISTMIISLATGLTTATVVILLVGVAFVENHRVHEAITYSITSDTNVASIAALMIVSLLVVIPIIEVQEKINKGTFKFDDKADDEVELSFTIRHFWYRFRNFLGLWEEAKDNTGKIIRYELPKKYRYRPAPSRTKNITNLKYALVFVVMVLAFIASSHALFDRYSTTTMGINETSLPFLEGVNKIITTSNIKEVSDILINVLFTGIIAIAEITLATFAAELSARAYREVQNIKDKIEKEEEVIDGVYFVKEVDESVSRALSSIKNHPKIKDNDKIKISKDGFNFYDSEKENWLSETGFNTANYLKQKVSVLLEKRK